MHRELEAKRIRALLNHLRLDGRANGYECRNNFRDFIKRLAEFQSMSSESSHVDMLVNQIANQDHGHAVETLKGAENLTLEKRYFEVISKATDLGKITNESIKPRNTKINQHRGFHEDDLVNLKDYAQRNRVIKLPYSVFNGFSDDKGSN